MKATELMIGDWVARVFSAISGRRPYSERPLRCDLELINHLFTGSQPECGIVPIPLTEDILKANLGEQWNTKTVHWGNIHLSDMFWITVYKDCINENGDNVGSMEISWRFRYVHELQHALRLCGLTEEADNFKIKAMEE